MGNHIDVLNGKWTAQDAGIGAGVDSYFEYLLKGGILLSLPRLVDMFKGRGQTMVYPCLEVYIINFACLP